MFYFSETNNEILTDPIDFASNSILIQESDIDKYLIVRIVPLLDQSKETKIIYGKIQESKTF